MPSDEMGFTDCFGVDGKWRAGNLIHGLHFAEGKQILCQYCVG